jgi:hypothetical protein
MRILPAHATETNTLESLVNSKAMLSGFVQL